MIDQWEQLPKEHQRFLQIPGMNESIEASGRKLIVLPHTDGTFRLIVSGQSEGGNQIFLALSTAISESKTYPVGIKEPIANYRDEKQFNPVIVKKLNTLADEYKAFRGVRGDGNCYHRSVLYGYLEQVLCSDYKAQHLKEFLRFLPFGAFFAEKSEKLLDPVP